MMTALINIQDALSLIATIMVLLFGIAAMVGGVVMLFRHWNRETP